MGGLRGEGGLLGSLRWAARLRLGGGEVYVYVTRIQKIGRWPENLKNLANSYWIEPRVESYRIASYHIIS